MPIYEYKCEGCGETFELIQKFSDEPLTVHEKCGGHVHRIMSSPAFQFKGTGWYVTYYAKGNASGPPKHDSAKGDASKGDSGKTETTASAETKSESKSETKSESKSESKAESKPAASSEKS